MARQNAPTRLTLKLQTGFDMEKGLPILKSVSYSNIVPSADDTALHSLAVTLGALSSNPVHQVLRTDTATLTGE